MKATGLLITRTLPAWPAAFGARWTALRRLVSGTHALALADQAVVSGVSFATTVMIARATTPGELGSYAIAISLLASMFAVQDSLLLQPYSIRRHRPPGTPAEHAGGVLTLSALMSAVIVSLLTVIALYLSISGADRHVTAMTWVLTGVLPFALLREFGRRFAFAHLQLARALVLDVAVAAIQLGVMGWLAWSGRMSAVTAFAALGAAHVVTGIAWLYLARAEFVIGLRQLRLTIRQSWELGKWLLAGKLTVQVQVYITYWLSMAMLGATVTGIYAACMSIVAFANPLVFGLGNILTPRSVLAWKNGGGSALRRQAIYDALLYAAILAPFCLAVFVAGESIMRLLYPSGEFAGQGQTVAVLSLAVLATALGMPASNALASMERPRAIVVAATIGMIVTVALVWLLMFEGGLTGAAYGALSGNAIGAAARWTAFLALVPRSGDPAPALRAAQQLTGSPAPGDWAVSRYGEGDHAVVYGIEAKDRQAVWRTHRAIAVKLFKPAAGLDAPQVKAQFDGLSRLHGALDGRVFDGWRIATPRPLYLCQSPLALVMSMVPGRDLAASAARADRLTPEVLDAAARACIAAMQEVWSQGQVHGDFGLQNILFGLDPRTLSLIDPGTPESCRVCNGTIRHQRPLALDLAHFLTDLGTDVTDLIGNPAARARRQAFAESALRAVFATIGAQEARLLLLEDLRSGVHAHLDAALRPSFSVRGLWHGFIKQIAVRRIDSLLDRIAAELRASVTAMSL